MSKDKDSKLPNRDCCDLESCCEQAPSLLRQLAAAIEKCCGTGKGNKQDK